MFTTNNQWGVGYKQSGKVVKNGEGLGEDCNGGEWESGVEESSRSRKPILLCLVVSSRYRVYLVASGGYGDLFQSPTAAAKQISESELTFMIDVIDRGTTRTRVKRERSGAVMLSLVSFGV